MRDLAERLQVNTSTISRMEASERDGTIGVGTLGRALEAMGFSLHLGCEPVRGDRIALEMHRAIADRIRRDPDAVLGSVADTIAQLRRVAQRDLPRGWLDLWEQLISGSVDTLIDTMLDQSLLGRELRRHSPFGGVLTHDERVAAIERAIRFDHPAERGRSHHRSSSVGFQADHKVGRPAR